MEEYSYGIHDAKEEIKNDVRIYLRKNEDGSYLLPASKKNPIYIVGEPGIGKTEMAKQIADELGIGFYATSLTHHTRNSVLGLPTITELQGEKVTEYTMPDILTQVERCVEQGQTEGILLIDEFASMSDALVAPMLAFLQNKSIGNHALPEGWIMLLCSNPPEYNETAREFDAAVMDRVRYMRVTYSAKDFLQYAEQIHIYPLIIEYIRKHPDSAYICEETKGNKEIVTARSWENLSHCMYGYDAIGAEITERLVYQFIKSTRVAHEFTQYYVLSSSTLGEEDIRKLLCGINVPEYLSKVRKLDYEKKWRVVKLLQDDLLVGTEEIERWGRYLDFLGNMILRWSFCFKSENTEDTDSWGDIFNKMEIRKESFQRALAYFAGRGTAANVHSELQEVELPEKWKELQKRMATDVLDAMTIAKNNQEQLECEQIIQEMYNWLDHYTMQNTAKMKVKNNNIANAIKFIKALGDPILGENFIRTINQQGSLLYILAKNRNPVYVQAMTPLLGECG